MGDAIQILVVDGDAESRGKLKEQLQNPAAKILEADSTTRAFDLFQAHAPQIVITDLNFPNTAGVEFTRRLAHQAPHVLIAVMTSGATEQLIIECLKAGASDFLTKPIEPDALQLVVSRFVDLVQRRQDKLFTPDVIESAALDLTLRSAGRSVPPAVSAVCELVRGFVTSRELQRIELALNEVIRNAYEHGNLGITFDEKATVCEAGSFEELLGKRSEFAQKQGKFIRVRARLAGNTFTVCVEDEGKGFDWRAMMTRDPLDSIARMNGRGLFLIARTFEKVEYNEKGNIITLTKTLL